MKRNLILVVFVFALGAITSACSPTIPAAVISVDSTTTAVSAVQPIATEIRTATIPAPTATPSIPLTTYHDDTSGFTFDYPTGWMIDPLNFGLRAPSGYQITSWQHDPGLVSSVPVDGTDINIVVQLWDPKGDLQAFVNQRTGGWGDAQIKVTRMEDFVLVNGNPAKIFFVQGPDGADGYFMFSTLGEDYLVVSGNGDLEKIDIVARSIR